MEKPCHVTFVDPVRVLRDGVSTRVVACTISSSVAVEDPDIEAGARLSVTEIVVDEDDLFDTDDSAQVAWKGTIEVSTSNVLSTADEGA